MAALTRRTGVFYRIQGVDVAEVAPVPPRLQGPFRADRRPGSTTRPAAQIAIAVAHVQEGDYGYAYHMATYGALPLKGLPGWEVEYSALEAIAAAVDPALSPSEIRHWGWTR